MLDDLQEKYLDEIRSMFPLHRVVLGMLGFIFGMTLAKQTHKSISESLIHLQLKTFSFDDGQFFEQSEIWHLLLGFGLCLFSWGICRSISKKFLAFLMKKLKIEARIQNETKKLRSILNMTNSPPKELLSHLNQQSESAKRSITRLSNLAELCMGVFLIFGAASYWGNAIDLATAFIFFATSIYSTYKAVYLFFSKYIKFDLLNAALLGTRPDLDLPAN